MSQPTFEDLVERAEAAYSDLKSHEETWGSDPDTMPPGQRERRERLRNAFSNAQIASEDFAARQAKLDAIKEASKNPRLCESGFGGGYDEPTRNRANPWNSGAGDHLSQIDTPSGLRSRAIDAAERAPGLTDHGRNSLTTIIETDNDPRASTLVLAATDPAYRTALERLLADPIRGHLV